MKKIILLITILLLITTTSFAMNIKDTINLTTGVVVSRLYITNYNVCSVMIRCIRQNYYGEFTQFIKVLKPKEQLNMEMDLSYAFYIYNVEGELQGFLKNNY